MRREPDARSHGESPERTALASIGLCVRSASPALLHAIRGCLHDVTMLTALLQPRDDAARPGDARTAQRVSAIRAQLEALERNVALLGALTRWPSRAADAACATADALPEVVRVLRDAAARERLRLDHDLDGLPPHVRAEASALQQTLIACGAWAAQHAAGRAALRFVGREERDEAVFEFDTGIAPAGEELGLLAALAEAAGARLEPASPLRVSFARATGPAVG